MVSNKIILSKEQEDLIIATWNDSVEPPSISHLIFIVFDKKNMDGRSFEGIAIRDFLTKRGMKEKVVFVKKGFIELTEDQKEYIKNNYKSMRAVEMTRILFNNDKLVGLSQEARSVLAYIKTLNPEESYANEKELEDFKPPRNIDKLIPLINSIVIDAYNPEKYDNHSKRCLEANLGYLMMRRFNTEIAGYSDQVERDMYLSNFIRHTYDKFDLNQQDLDNICLFAHEVINHKKLKKRLEKLEDLLDKNLEGDEKTSMTLVENLSQTQKDIDKSAIRQTTLLNEIGEKRSARMKKERESTSSLLNLMAAWREEESRNKMIDIAEKRKEELKKTVREFSDMDQFRAAIWGMSEDELING